jgi:glycosyltransferase involved in cell wall biosynthesis
VYAYQEWGSTKQNYEVMNQIELPNELREPSEWVSVLICSYNTKSAYIQECLNSIKSQNGNFGMEIVWINDGSDELNTKLLENLLKRFENTTRFCKVVYQKTVNSGVCKSLHDGLLLCTNEIILRMDSDDIMLPDRIQKQIQFMKEHPETPCCGSNIRFLVNTDLRQQTNHPFRITWDEYKKTPSEWFMNHPTLCFRKSAILSIGNYDIVSNVAFEDLELEVKLLKKFGVLYNLQDVLLNYRIHDNQVTYNGKTSTSYWREKRQKFIQHMIETP